MRFGRGGKRSPQAEGQRRGNRGKTKFDAYATIAEGQRTGGGKEDYQRTQLCARRANSSKTLGQVVKSARKWEKHTSSSLPEEAKRKKKRDYI